jgi:hypothetical protein
MDCAAPPEALNAVVLEE